MSMSAAAAGAAATSSTASSPSAAGAAPASSSAAGLGSAFGLGLGLLSTVHANLSDSHLLSTAAVRSVGSACAGEASCFVDSAASQSFAASISAAAFSLSEASMCAVSEDATSASKVEIAFCSAVIAPGLLSASTARELAGAQSAVSSSCFAV